MDREKDGPEAVPLRPGFDQNAGICAGIDRCAASLDQAVEHDTGAALVHASNARRDSSYVGRAGVSEE